jgi:excisionase family DNA binding protein
MIYLAPMTTEPKTAPASKRGFLTLDEAAEIIGCTRRFIEQRIEDGEIAKFQPSGRLIRIRVSEFDRWVESFTTRKAGAA